MKGIRYISAFLACMFVFATGHSVQIRRGSGTSIPEHILPTDRDNPELWAPASKQLLTRAVAPGGYALNDIPRTDTIVYPLVLVDFIDRPFTIRDTTALLKRYERMFNEEGYTDSAIYIHRGIICHGATGSVSDYFRDQSYGQFVPKFEIIGPVHPSKSYAYYGNGKDANVVYLIREICDSISAKGLVDLSGFARNGSIDQLSVIYAGRGENYDGSDINTIWPQASIISNYNRHGINSIKYACTCELFWDSDTILDGIGTFCHEFSHTLGLPDFYNTTSQQESETNSSMGYWSLMDYGNYENEGFSPVGYTAFEKYSLGWMDIEEISYAGSYTLNDISIKADLDNDIHTAYRLNTGHDDQFIILENHIKTGWYKYHASEGLMVTAVNYDNNSWVNNTVNSNRAIKHYYILPADNDRNRNTNAGDLFPYQNIDSITTLGTPTLKVGSSYPPYSIYQIRFNNGIVSFHASPDMPSNIENRQIQDVSINLEDGRLSVNAPAGSTVTIYDISGRPVSKIITSEPVQQLQLPGHGIWIIKCGDVVRKIQK